jgi:hypothetical protein
MASDDEILHLGILFQKLEESTKESDMAGWPIGNIQVAQSEGSQIFNRPGKDAAAQDNTSKSRKFTSLKDGASAYQRRL